MNEIIGKIVNLMVRGVPRSGGELDGFVDSLLQKFEDCRHGLSDDSVLDGGETAEAFFVKLYEGALPSKIGHCVTVAR